MTTGPARAGSWRVPGGAVVALALAFVASLPLVTPRVYAVDEIQYFAYLPSLLHGGDLDFAGEYAALLGDRADALDGRALLQATPTARGLLPNYAGIGCAVFWLPWYLGAELVAAIGPWPRDGLSAPYRAAVAYGSAFYAMAALLLLFAAASQLVDRRAALLATVAAWWATALPFYMYVTPPMSHATSLFAVSGFLYLWLRWRGRIDGRRALVLGLMAGLMAMVREQNVLFVLPVALEILTALRSPERRPWAFRSAASLGIGFALVFSLQMIVWFRLFASIGPPPLRVGFVDPWPRHLLDVLVSGERGLLVWHPIWIVGLVGMFLFARRMPAIGWPLLLAFGAQLWFLGGAANWSGGMAFGQRRLVAASFVVVLGGAEVIRRVPWRAAVVAAVLLVWLNLSLLVQFGTGMIPRQSGVPASWSTILRNHVTEVPRRALGIAGRYLFARGELYDDDEVR